MFVDDLFLFGRVDESTTYSVRGTVEKFCEISGRKLMKVKANSFFHFILLKN